MFAEKCWDADSSLDEIRRMTVTNPAALRWSKLACLFRGGVFLVLCHQTPASEEAG